MTHSQSHSPAGSPSPGEIALSLTTSPRTLIRVAREFQLEKNRAEEEVRNLRRKFEDIHNKGIADDAGSDGGNSRKRRREGSPQPGGSDEKDNDGEDDEHSVFQAGHLFVMICGPWLRRGDKIFKIPLDGDYEDKTRFENADHKLQGQLHDIRSVLPEKYHYDLFEAKWLAKMFTKGMAAQRSNTSSRLRHQCAAIFKVDPLDMLDSKRRKELFRERIGWVMNDQGNGSYSSMDVEIIHKNSSKEFNYQTAFLNPILMQVFVAIIRGPNTALKLKKGGPSCSKTETMELKHRIRNTTPGAIATSTILARWALSEDDFLQEQGSRTGINWMTDYEEYMEILTTGLRQKKKSILHVFREWDKTIFPDTDSSLVSSEGNTESSGLKRALEMLDGDSEDGEDEGNTSNSGVNSN